jgi:glycosyltransferase involved in cell wall biosynthesis
LAHTIGRRAGLAVYTDHSNFARRPQDGRSYAVGRMYMEYALDTDVCLLVERASHANFSRRAESARSNCEAVFAPNTVDTGLFAFEPLPASPPLRVGFAGRLDPVRGTNLLREFLRRLPDRVEVDLALAVKRKQDIDRFLAAIDMGPRIRVRSNVPQAEMPSFLSGVHLLLNPVLVESMSRATLEAMSCGRAAIMVDIGDRYPTIPGETGYLIPHDVGALVSLVSRLRDAPAELAERGREARRIVEREFSLETGARLVRAVYERRRGPQPLKHP